MTYQECLAEIASYEGRGIYRGLDRMEEACRRLDHPERRFPSVHVGGTNGKGSTCAILAEILKRAGHRVGLTVSPHIQTLRERIQVGGEWISRDDFVRLHCRLKDILHDLPLTYFEWIILMSFTHFAESQVDVAVVEVGLGGRWDATNVLQPLAGAITNVSLDHEAILGFSPEEILTEKMQIVKPGMAFWTGIAEPHLLTQLKSHCAHQGVNLSVLEDHFMDHGDGSFSLFHYSHLRCGLLGEHQKRNAAQAVALAQSLKEKGFAIPDRAVIEGVAQVRWPGRLEVVSETPRIIVDGAHNRAGITTLARYLERNRGKYRLVFGALKDRPLEEMLEPLRSHCHRIHLALFESNRSLPSAELAEKAVSLGMDAEAVLPIEALPWARFLKSLEPDETVLVAGSLYLVSQVRGLIKHHES